MNAILSIRPYRDNSIWFFDDATRHIKYEAFVLGMSEIIDELYNKTFKERPKNGDFFIAMFSEHYIPSPDLVLVFMALEGGGAWYRSPVLDRRGWFCPVLFAYFTEAPAQIFIKALPIQKKNLWTRFKNWLNGGPGVTSLGGFE